MYGITKKELEVKRDRCILDIAELEAKEKKLSAEAHVSLGNKMKVKADLVQIKNKKLLYDEILADCKETKDVVHGGNNSVIAR